MSNIAIIPARSGSKGIKDKNIREVCGKPLLAHSIECALHSKQFDMVFVSTDSERYAEIATQYGANASFLRSAANARDTSNSWDAVREAILHFEEQGFYYDNIMLLQPTSPLRTVSDIRNSFELLYEKDARPLVFIEEPENGLYHKYLPDLAIQMKNSIRGTYSKQLFITTHSPFFVNALTPDEVWVLEKQEDGYSTIKRASEFMHVKQLCGSEIELGDLWYSNYFG